MSPAVFQSDGREGWDTLSVQIDLGERDQKFFDAIIRDRKPVTKPHLVLLTHVLPDRPPLIGAFARLGHIRRVIAIPYSADEDTIHELRSMGLPLELPEMSQLEDPKYLGALLTLAAEEAAAPLILCEIGGYFASVPGLVEGTAVPALTGVVEDTEAGHRRYAEAGAAGIPIVSAARSPLKEPEDRLIGESVAFSLERVLRDHETVMAGTRITVLGFGKIGASCASAVRARGAVVSVFDINPIRRVRAAADGFPIPERTSALRSADVVIGATGQGSVRSGDLDLLRDRCLLCSASSRKVEFVLGPDRERVRGDERVHILKREGRGPVLLLNDGAPINFLDRGVVGPMLRLVQAELLAATAEISSGTHIAGLGEISGDTRARLTDRWIEVYVDAVDGRPRS
jgi:adenosylhomocysteinase